MAAEEFTQAMNGVREFNRLQGIDLKLSVRDDFRRSAAQRAGQRNGKWCRRIRVFCTSPATRRRCARIWKRLSQTHNVTRLALFDQFPYTHHMECGVLLTKK
jgi:tRNA (uracil-5-)-methyltransferase